MLVELYNIKYIPVLTTMGRLLLRCVISVVGVYDMIRAVLDDFLSAGTYHVVGQSTTLLSACGAPHCKVFMEPHIAGACGAPHCKVLVEHHIAEC